MRARPLFYRLHAGQQQRVASRHAPSALLRAYDSLFFHDDDRARVTSKINAQAERRLRAPPPATMPRALRGVTIRRRRWVFLMPASKGAKRCRHRLRAHDDGLPPRIAYYGII